MITVLTGTPGAGKTLYAISELLFPLYDFAAGKWKPIAKRNEDGTEGEVERTVYTNINGLLVDHELVQSDGEQGLHNWHKWAKPGSLIVVDEFQKIWPPRPNGSKVPDDVQAFDTHRHMGVDFILITQNAMNVDRHLHGLTGRHLHVRRMANMHLAIVYEWDHCSRTLLYSKAFTKSPWRYKKKAFKFYKSSELHTKQRNKLPGLVWFVVAGLAGLGYLIPSFQSRMAERIGGGSANAATVATPSKAIGGPAHRDNSLPARQAQAASAPAPAPLPLAAASAPVLASIGCIRMASRCKCFESNGKPADRPLDFCEDQTGVNAPVKLAESARPDWEAPRAAVRIEDIELMHAAHALLDKRRTRGHAGL